MKVNRNYRFVLTSCQEKPAAEGCDGERMFTSECHYYCEKEVISLLKAAEKNGTFKDYVGHIYAIYKETKPETTTETRTTADGLRETVIRECPTTSMLVETIVVTAEGIEVR